MDKLTRGEKYFKRSIAYFLNNFLPESLTGSSNAIIKLMYDYDCYIKRSTYRETFDRSGVEKLASAYPEAINKDSFMEGVDAMSNHVDTVMIALKQENATLRESLRHQKDKNKMLKNEFIRNIKKLEAKLQTSVPVLAKMQLAYKAGQDSVEAIAKRGLNPEAEEYIILKKQVSFGTWANKIWKYGKAEMNIKRGKKYKHVEIPDRLEANLVEIRERAFADIYL